MSGDAPPLVSPDLPADPTATHDPGRTAVLPLLPSESSPPSISTLPRWQVLGPADAAPLAPGNAPTFQLEATFVTPE